MSAWERHGTGRVGIEFYYVGRQRLDDNPFRATSRPYLIVGAPAERRFGRFRVFLNAENLGDSRQTRHDSLVRPFLVPDGRRTVDVWAPSKDESSTLEFEWRSDMPLNTNAWNRLRYTWWSPLYDRVVLVPWEDGPQ